ncbi:MAG: pilus assembly protein [Alphaproteobacteria bacterium]|nr:pilus assembly protein [Alphaproteobacteria bacterium]MCB9693419.1 pilus assembly protein [Alphaproteobacteria bacterium]
MARFHRRHRRGANAIEFALTLPVFLLVTFGMMEYGWYFAKTAQVNGAVAHSCREGSLIDPKNVPAYLGSCTGYGCVEKQVEDLLIPQITSSNLACNDCSATVSGSVPNIVVDCVADVQYIPLTAYLPANVVTPDRILARTRVRAEWQRLNP